MNVALKWSVWLVATTAAVLASYAWLDRPIALGAHLLSQRVRAFEQLTRIPEFMVPLILIFVAALALSVLSGRKLSRLGSVLTLTVASLAISELTKEQLKFVFGRTWPETWIRNNPSFIRDGAYGFHPFHGGAAYASFPSGHTAATCAVISVLWVCYPRFRLLYALVVATVAIGLVGADFHFVSDVIAGGFLGSSIGWFTVAVWETGARPVRPPSMLD